SGILWIGTWSGGLNKLSRAARRNKSYVLPNNTVVWDVLEDRAGNLWAGTSHGLYHIKGPGRDEWTQVLPGDVYVLHESRSGALWVGTRGQGFYMFDPKTGARTLYRHDPNDPASLADDSINFIYEDRAGTLWVGGTGALLQRLNEDRKSFTRYRIGKAFALETLLEDRRGNLWVGTIAEGICRFARETGTSTCYGHEQDNPASLSENNVVTLHEDGQGLLWLGTANKGLVQFDVRANTFRSFDARNSCLRADRINAILEDARGILWLSTNKGVIRFDPRKESCVSYGVYDGLLSLQGTNESSLQSRQGEFFFGSYGGLHVFFPEDLEALRASPKVVLTEVRLFNQTLQPGPGSPLRQTSIWAEELVLAHDQNSLAFDFAALDFTHPELHQYKYRLEGFDSEWIEAGTRHSATYTNLDSGSYVFRVLGASEGGMWQEGSTALRVVILPPWWRTRWAYGSYGLLLVAALFVAESLQRQRLIRKERARAEHEQARLKAEATERELQQARAIEQAYAELKRTQARLLQQEKLASLGRLSAGIAHEIRNPLNFIHNFAQLSTELSAELRRELEAERGHLDPKRHADLEEMLTMLEANTRKIEQHGQRADGIVRSMLKHSRTTSGQRQATDLNVLLEEYLALISHDLRGQHPQDNVKIERDYDPQVGEIELAPQEMGRVFLNLLDNAFYFAREQKTRPDRAAQQPLVRVETRRQDKQIEIRVADNGPGIQEALKEKIFEPFFTTKPAGQGTGLGLSLSYDIVVQGHGGTLSVESEEGRGAVFIIRLSKE
ncbi:MAG TPA: two-component regulator propeller domain-containing protein, partial [Archangium sp.]|nr:two-component regulator propeller domain-containing protein [Archangium sp.]